MGLQVAELRTWSVVEQNVIKLRYTFFEFIQKRNVPVFSTLASGRLKYHSFEALVTLFKMLPRLLLLIMKHPHVAFDTRQHHYSVSDPHRNKDKDVQYCLAGALHKWETLIRAKMHIKFVQLSTQWHVIGVGPIQKPLLRMRNKCISILYDITITSFNCPGF